MIIVIMIMIPSYTNHDNRYHHDDRIVHKWWWSSSSWWSHRTQMTMIVIIMIIASYTSYMHWLCTMRYFSVTDEPTNKAILGVGSRESAAGQHLFCFFYISYHSLAQTPQLIWLNVVQNIKNLNKWKKDSWFLDEWFKLQIFFEKNINCFPFSFQKSTSRAKLWLIFPGERSEESGIGEKPTNVWQNWLRIYLQFTPMESNRRKGFF